MRPCAEEERERGRIYLKLQLEALNPLQSVRSLKNHPVTRTGELFSLEYFKTFAEKDRGSRKREKNPFFARQLWLFQFVSLAGPVYAQPMKIKVLSITKLY